FGFAGERVLLRLCRLARRLLLFAALLRRGGVRREAEPHDGDDGRRPGRNLHDLLSPSFITDDVRARATPTSGTPYDPRISRISAYLLTRKSSSSPRNASSSRRTPNEMS